MVSRPHFWSRSRSHSFWSRSRSHEVPVSVSWELVSRSLTAVDNYSNYLASTSKVITKFSCIFVECWHSYIRTASTSQSQCCVCRLDSSHYIEHFACVGFTEFLFLPYSFNRTGLGLGLIVFGLGLTRHVWSRSRSHSLWSRSRSRSHCVVVSLTSLLHSYCYWCLWN